MRPPFTSLHPFRPWLRSLVSRPVFRAGAVLALLVAPACSDDALPGVVPVSDPFCSQVLPRVQSFLDRTRAEQSLPDDAQFGGTVVVAGLGELSSGMNVAATADYISNQHQQFVNLMTLLDYDDDLIPRPWLAESWEVSPDGTELTFHLRDDVFWHDGTPTTARDVAFTYLRLTDPATGFPNAAFWDRYVTGEEGVEILDDYTVRIRLEPHADFLDPWRAVAILPEHLLGEVPPGELQAHPWGTRCPVGNGPFVFLEHRDQELWSFAANPAFPRALGGRPFLDRYLYRVIPDENTLLLELLSGGIDVFISPQPDQAPRIVEEPGVRLLSYPFRNFTFVAWNSRRPQLADSRVRRAITLGLDRDAMVDALLGGYGVVSHGSVPPWHWAFDPEAGVMERDVDRAVRLLEEAGWVDRDGDGVREDAAGLPLAFSITTNQGNRRLQRVAVVMQDHLGRLGMDVEVETLEWSSLVARITNTERRDYDGVLLSWVTEFKLDDTDLLHSERIDQPYGFSGTDDPELDRLLDLLGSVTDRAEAQALWREYQEALARVQPFTFLYFPDRLDGVRERVRGVKMDARGEWVNLREWWIDPEFR